MENKVNITQNNDGSVQFQAVGSWEFVEHMSDKAIKEYFNIDSNEKTHTPLTYNGREGYHGQPIEKIVIDDEPTETNETSLTDLPDWQKTGIKYDEYGNERKKCRYICNHCGKAGNRYVRDKESVIFCHDCNEKMTVKRMIDEYGVECDEYKNHAYAGAFYPKDLV